MTLTTLLYQDIDSLRLKFECEPIEVIFAKGVDLPVLSASKDEVMKIPRFMAIPLIEKGYCDIQDSNQYIENEGRQIRKVISRMRYVRPTDQIPQLDKDFYIRTSFFLRYLWSKRPKLAQTARIDLRQFLEQRYTKISQIAMYGELDQQTADLLTVEEIDYYNSVRKSVKEFIQNVDII